MSDNKIIKQLKSNKNFAKAYREYNHSIGDALRVLNEQKHSIEGRDEEIKLLQAVLERPLTPVALLLGQAGVGKTALVEEYVKQLNNHTLPNTDYDYCLFALRIGQLSSIGIERLQSELALIFDNIKKLEALAQKELNNKRIRFILFIDEVHMLVTIFGPGTKIGGDVMKDILARSPIRIIAATTKLEYDSTIAVDKPLSERFKVIELQELPQEVIEKISQSWWLKHSGSDQLMPPSLIKKIIQANKVFRSDSAEPRKTLDILEDCVSYYKRFGKMIDENGINNIFKQRYSINLSFNIKADKVYDGIERNILGQNYALYLLKRMLRSTMFKLDINSNRPIFTALFCGSTGTGKGLLLDDYTSTINGFKKNRDVKVGDKIFDRLGNITTVNGVFPQGMKDIYEITFSDGRKIKCDNSHLWGYYTKKQKTKSDLGGYKKLPEYNVISTEEIYNNGLYKQRSDGRKELKYYIPMNKAVGYIKKDFNIHPYNLGVLIADGCLTSEVLTISSNDKFVIDKFSSLLPNKNKVIAISKLNYNYNFLLNGESVKSKNAKYLQSYHFGNLYGLFGLKSHEMFIPEEFKFGSIEQRWQLIQGLFDCDGSISDDKSKRFSISYSSTSKKLISDIIEVLYSLGVSTSKVIERFSNNNDKNTQYTISVLIGNENKHKFFTLPRKVEIANKAKEFGKKKKRIKKYNFIAIIDIKKLEEKQETICFKVDNKEHLFQTGKNYIVTHNTATTKAISENLYPGEKVLLNINMPDYKLPNQDGAFRKKLGETIRHKPNSIILLDELEKAHESIKDSLLAILDEGIVNFNVVNREGGQETHFVSLRNSIIIATSNEGHQVFQDDARFSSKDDDENQKPSDISKAEIESLNVALKEHLQKNGFKPELLGRFNAIIPYRGLSQKTMVKIAEIQINEIIDNFRINHGIELITNPIKKWDGVYSEFETTDLALYIVTSKTNADDTRSGGARAVKRAVMDALFDNVIDAIIDNENTTKFKVEVDKHTKIFDSGLAYTDGGINVIPIK